MVLIIEFVLYPVCVLGGAKQPSEGIELAYGRAVSFGRNAAGRVSIPQSNTVGLVRSPEHGLVLQPEIFPWAGSSDGLSEAAWRGSESDIEY